MIDEKKLAELRRMMGDSERVYYPANGPWITHGEICDSLEALWRVARAADKFQSAWYRNGAINDENNELLDALAALKKPY